MKLRDYQQKILDKSRHLASMGLFMGTGTGKTYTSLCKFEEQPTKKLLVVSPKSVLTQWEANINEHFSHLRVLKFPKKNMTAVKKNEFIKENAQNFDVTIVNFEVLYKIEALYGIINPEWTIIIDESHRIKALGTRKSPVKQTKAALALGKQTPYKIILTATPTQGNYGGYIDLFTQLKFLGYYDGELRDFKYRYVKEQDMMLPGRPYPIKTIRGYRNTDELDNILANTCFRYTPKHGDYPPEHIKVDIERASSYAKTQREMVYKDIIFSNVSRKRIGLKTLTGGKISGLNEFGDRFTYEDNNKKIEWLKDFIKDTDEKLVIFYQYNVEKDLILELLDKLGKTYVVINGQTEDKYTEINEKEYDIAVGQFQAMSESIDGLQHISHIMIMYSMPESSLTYKQAIGRIDRIGQEKVPMYYYLVMEKTIDEAIYNMIEQKVEFSEEVLDKLDI